MGADGRAKRGELPTKKRAPLAVEDTSYALMVCLADRVVTHVLPGSGAYVIGRAADCDLPIDEESVSRRHLKVHCGDPPLAEDLGSSNGSRVAGRAIAPGERAQLGLGQVVHLGDVPVVVERAPDEDAPPEGVPSMRVPLPHNVVVRDRTMLGLYGLVEVFAPSDLPILILGETGVGKEVYAQTVHDRSPRAGGPFLRLNCAALPESLLEAELFGFEKGAFTGATAAKPGLFEAADKGSVFLDEIGEAALSVQAKLLRVLETGEVTRIGSVSPRHVDVRFLSATNRDLEREVSDGRFRADLFFRINGMVVTLPPLRERPDDVIALAEHFLAAGAAKAGRPSARLSDGAKGALRTHAWPGNARELRNVVERAALVARGAPIEASHLGLKEPAPAAPLRGDVASFERQRILDALAECAGNQTQAAKLLGIGRRTLITKIEQHGIQRPRKK
jgi:transcriptional regulator with GAF, ATPase, and Fis domain